MIIVMITVSVIGDGNSNDDSDSKDDYDTGDNDNHDHNDRNDYDQTMNAQITLQFTWRDLRSCI